MFRAGGSSSKKIGILGGIGPEATGNFYLRLIARLQGTGRIESNTDFPQILVNSIPAPELVGEHTTGKELAPYFKGLIELEAANVDFIAMACNTIHLHHKMLQSRIRTPIIDLREELRLFMWGRGVGSMVVLGTPQTMRKGLYRLEGVKYYELEEMEAKEIGEAISNFNSGLDRQGAARRVDAVARKYVGLGAEVVVLGCTEISLMLLESRFDKVDTMDVLVDAVLRNVYGKNAEISRK
ncbi:MAG: aspartate/glutamate racemase family protein [Candidatus Micrarchaeota archaeon]|nr:aspartate/glutamate racemase family protein [Candidatus Micrarchaeota archaeon]MDE1847346.1 aspartate/glutamate racemase family protein [Candidatus Micrarchaeota archaeon]MDE1863961.1 aspartate/glutamate racemase family protein [Candidatus Micrarchaeota archaeon]